MTAEERSCLETLDKILRSADVRALIAPIVERVRAELRQKQKAVMTWESMPLATFGDTLPPAIRSSWVFILRAGANTGAERHPNSHQRMMSFEGRGDMQVEDQAQMPGVKDRRTDGALRWRSNVLVSDLDAPLERRWISIPQNVWHQPVIAKSADWVVVSFHTVPAEELIEERPDSGGEEGTKQMIYLSKKIEE